MKKKHRSKHRVRSVDGETWIRAYVRRRGPVNIRVHEFPSAFRNLIEEGGDKDLTNACAIASILLSATAQTCGINLRPLHDLHMDTEIDPLARCLQIEQAMDTLSNLGVVEADEPNTACPVGRFLDTWVKGLRAGERDGERAMEAAMEAQFSVKLDPLSNGLLDMTRDHEPREWALRWLPQESWRRLNDEAGEVGPRVFELAAMAITAGLRWKVCPDSESETFHSNMPNEGAPEVLPVLAAAIALELPFERLARRRCITPDWYLDGAEGSTFLGYAAEAIFTHWRAGEYSGVGEGVMKALAGRGVFFETAPGLSVEQGKAVRREIAQGLRRALGAE